MLSIAVVGLDTGETLLRLGLAVALGGAIGLEREFHGRPAGLRTHIMVCLGATIVMLVSVALSMDPGRIAAGILTGIGFIGAGAVLRLKATNRGLTTAACIWFVASLGVVIGVGAYWVGAGGTLLALVVLMVLSRVEKWIEPAWYREVVVVADREEIEIWRVRTLLEEKGFRVESYDYQDEVEKGEIRVAFNVRFRRRDVGEELLKRLRELPGVRSIAWRVSGI